MRAGKGDIEMSGCAGYDCAVLTAVGAGFSSLNLERRTSATNGVFLRQKFINGERCGEARRLAGVLSGRSANPAHVRPPHLAVSGELQNLKGVPL